MTVRRSSFSIGATPTPTALAQDTVPGLATPSQRQEHGQSCFPSVIATELTGSSSGTKRNWSYSTRMPYSCPYLRRAMPGCDSNSFSKHQYDDSFEDSDSESYEESCCEEDSWVDGESVLPEGHPFRKVRRPLLRLARQRAKAFAANVRYVARSDHQPPPRKRPRSSKWLQESASLLKESGDDSDQEITEDGFLVVSKPEESSVNAPEEPFHFSCPFYKLAPKSYRQCLLHHELRTMDHVITHVRRHHKKPPYCPMCSQTFDTVTSCDRHILKRACAMGDLVIPEGINLNQRATLSKNDNRYLGNIERWKRVHDTVFPDKEPVASPYLDQGCGREISAARDYWRKHGWRCVSDVLARRETLKETWDDKRARMLLFKLTLEDLLVEIMEEFGHVQSE
ncbi:hypothetical protein NM208_g580 [Fusarium decemcellulare]|uniref:Uncharacterized protein n=1 Tax=Fusarium decemcellulare TaxID=57161 RepID=A0ACC1SYU8_9HYPO|nr:hypothetical protein NM208_g580 [Fusarium decemcellulare]